MKFALLFYVTSKHKLVTIWYCRCGRWKYGQMCNKIMCWESLLQNTTTPHELVYIYMCFSPLTWPHFFCGGIYNILKDFTHISRLSFFFFLPKKGWYTCENNPCLESGEVMPRHVRWYITILFIYTKIGSPFLKKKNNWEEKKHKKNIKDLNEKREKKRQSIICKEKGVLFT